MQSVRLDADHMIEITSAGHGLQVALYEYYPNGGYWRRIGSDIYADIQAVIEDYDIRPEDII